jgi:hypothetical protein
MSSGYCFLIEGARGGYIQGSLNQEAGWRIGSFCACSDKEEEPSEPRYNNQLKRRGYSNECTKSEAQDNHPVVCDLANNVPAGLWVRDNAGMSRMIARVDVRPTQTK